MSGPIDGYYFTDKAKRFRKLARKADPYMASALLELALECEHMAIKLDESPPEKGQAPVSTPE